LGTEKNLIMTGLPRQRRLQLSQVNAVWRSRHIKSCKSFLIQWWHL